ncbi:MAG: hypothetical protein J5646_02785 [Bacteroidales bacterium]|nr:hypothetical protein [Bacteroidales bacterium]
MKRVLTIMAVLALLAGCQKLPEEVQEDMHPFTQEELHKKQLDEAFAPFVEALELDTITDYRGEVLANSHISLRLSGIVYTYEKNGKTLLEVRYRLRRFTADFYGGITLEGKITPSISTDLEDLIHADVYNYGIRVASLGFETYEYTEAGETVQQLVPVFRFDDGTSYAVRSLLLVDPLIDYLLEYVLSTE